MVARNKGTPHPDLTEAVAAGLIHPWDAEWIARVSWENQPATVRNLVRAVPLRSFGLYADQGQSRLVGPTRRNARSE